VQIFNTLPYDTEEPAETEQRGELALLCSLARQKKAPQQLLIHQLKTVKITQRRFTLAPLVFPAKKGT
jgi:hypothetical protein